MNSVHASAESGASLTTPSSALQVAITNSVALILNDYDFFLYGVVASLVFPKLFFPNYSPVTSLLATFSTFFLGFAARPIGGVLFGHFGDRFGRKNMVVTTLVLTGSVSILMGLLPTYNMVGVWAPILLVILRALQGIALGGQYGGGILLAVEHAPSDKKAFYGAIVLSSTTVALALVTLIVLLVNLVSDAPGFLSWGWRIPFLLSVVVVATAIYLELRVEESPAFKQLKARRQTVRFPFSYAIREYPWEIIRGILMYAGASTMPFYVVGVFLISYGTGTLHLAKISVLLALVLSNVVWTAIVLWAGKISDRIGRRPVYLTGTLLLMIVAFPSFALIKTGNIALFDLGIFILGTPIWICWGATAAFFSEMFETRVRYTAVSLATQGGATLGAVGPFMATSILALSGGNIWFVALYYVVATLIAFVAALLSKETMPVEAKATSAA